MRILAIETVGSWGGAQCSFFENCTKLSQLQSKMEILPVVPKSPLADRLISKGFHPFLIPSFQLQKKISSFFAFRKVRIALRKIIDQTSPDILYSNSFSAWLPVASLSTDLPKIWHHRDLRIPKMLLSWGLSRANHVIAASQRIRSDLLSAADGLTMGKIHLIPNGVDTTRFLPMDQLQARKMWNLPEKGWIIGMVAHLVPWKAQPLFLEAAEKIGSSFPSAHFVLAGRDISGKQKEYRKSIHTQAEHLSIANRIHWIESEQQIETLYPALNLLIHPPIDEPFGRVVCEAMSCGIPVLASSPGGPDEIIIPHKNGELLVHPDADRIAEVAIRFLQTSALQKDMSKNARETIIEKFDSTRVAQDLIRLFSRFRNEK